MLVSLTSALAVLICIASASTIKYAGKSKAWSNITLRASKATWTQFQYVVADNNLDYFSVSDLNEMRINNASADDWNVVVYVDRWDGHLSGQKIQEIYDCDTNEAVNGLFNGSKILQKDGNRWCQIYSFTNELDTMNPENIEEFVSMFSAFQTTSTHFMLTFWDHGGAWSGFGDDEHTAGSNETVNNLDYLFESVAIGLKNTSLGRLDILGFDACIMADHSVLHYLDVYGITKYYIASEVSEPGDGWDYTAIDPSKEDPIEFGKALIDGFVNQGNVMAEGAGAGYTLAMFDMDKVSGFLSQFDTFITKATAAIEAHDYGMLMAILRGQALTIPAEEDFHIYDLGLFLEGLTADTNIFWNTCDDRITFAGDSSKESLAESIEYFQADFVRQDMTGSTIFYSTSGDDMNSFFYYNHDLKSNSYIGLLTVMNETLTAVKLDNARWTTDSCSATAPENLTFAIHGNRVTYSEDYGVYKLTTEVTATVMGATGTLDVYFEDGNYTTRMEVADLATTIVDEDFDNAQLVTYWDGKVALFTNAIGEDSDLYDKLDLNDDEVFSSGSLEFVSYDPDTHVPLGYIGKYPLYVYDDVDSYDPDAMPGSNGTNMGYLQFEVRFSNEEGESQSISIHDVKLYEIDVNQGVIAEVASTTRRVITPLASVEMDDEWDLETSTPGPNSRRLLQTDSTPATTEDDMDVIAPSNTGSWDFGTTAQWDGGNGSNYIPMGVLVWPNFTVELKDVSSNDSWNFVFSLDAYDVFGNEADTEFDVTNTSSWTWNVSTTEMPATTEMEMSTTEHHVIVGSETTEDDDPETTDGDGKSSEHLQKGLDDVPGFVWLILLCALLILVFVFAAMWWRSKQQMDRMVTAGTVGASPYVQMDDKGDGLL